jgi:uncharacterized protein DUF4375
MTASPFRPGTIAWAIIARVEGRANIHEGPEIFLSQFAALSEPERHLLATHWCDYEVCNGGLLQFFENSTGVLAPEAVDGYRALGLPEVAATVEEAISRFESPYPRDRTSRHAKVQELRSLSNSGTRPFDDLDERYYSLLPCSEILGRAADKYAAANVV